MMDVIANGEDLNNFQKLKKRKEKKSTQIPLIMHICG